MNEERGHRVRGRALRLTLAGLSLAAVIAVSLWESRERTSPGELHPSHVSVAELRGPGGCASCHGSVFRSMGQACLDCHLPVSNQMKDREGIHGGLDESQATRCQDCHVEHTNGTIALVSDSSFTLAGLSVPEEYRHETVTDFHLVDRHESLDCEHCHPNAHAVKLERGTSRFMGLEQACTRCHEDVHRGEFGPNCASCHGQAHEFVEAPLFVHNDAFALAGGHADVSCEDCHQSGSAHAVAALLNSPVTTRACAECHDSPHSEPFVARFAAAQDVAAAVSCEECHDPVRESFSANDDVMTAEFHAASGFRLDPPHASLECESCHEGIGAEHPPDSQGMAVRFASMFPGRAQNDCRRCHEDPHRGEFDNGFSRGDCLVCHVETHFSPTRFDAGFHARTGYALTGKHATASCSECHTQVHNERFLPVSTSCSSCHQDPHQNAMVAVGGVGKTVATPDCAQCHTTESFSAVSWTVADHGKWTRFKLVGAHAQTDCIACHLPTSKPGIEGRTFGFAQTSCSSCHSDPHAGQFVQSKVNDCARCHDETRPWNVLDFDHQRDARFALDEHHATLECAACHRPFDAGGGRAVTRYRPLGVACADCHGFQGKTGAAGR